LKKKKNLLENCDDEIKIIKKKKKKKKNHSISIINMLLPVLKAGEVDDHVAVVTGRNWVLCADPVHTDHTFNLRAVQFLCEFIAKSHFFPVFVLVLVLFVWIWSGREK
jgi:hypothetical protein